MALAAYFYPKEVTTGKAAVKTRYPLARKRSGKLVQNDRKVVVDVQEGKKPAQAGPLRTRAHAESATLYTSLARGGTLIAAQSCVELHPTPA